MALNSELILLAELSALNTRKVLTDGNLIAFQYFWQVPAATEKAAYDVLATQTKTPEFEYLAFPWATLIDGLRNNATSAWELLRVLNTIWAEHNTFGTQRRATVAQHIHADKFIEFFRACGITDLFWPHATIDRPEIDGISIHPFPLYPAQISSGTEVGDLHRHRPYVANFIGAYNPQIYLTDVREHIFRDAGSAPDLLIIKRQTWHFDRAVYTEQMKGITPDQARLTLEEQHKTEYLDAIRDSAFTLCPTGSGPNSIRVGEALALASIPIILTRQLALPGARTLWENACLIEEDNAEGYRRALARAREMPADELRAKQAATRELFARIKPEEYGNIIEQSMAATASRL